MGMSQSVNLPSGMLESLGKYKEALKETKREMRELEREARRMQKGGGTVSREVAGRLETARGSRARLEDAIVQQKVVKRSSMGTATSMAVGGVAGGASASVAISKFSRIPSFVSNNGIFPFLGLLDMRVRKRKNRKGLSNENEYIRRHEGKYQDINTLTDFMGSSNRRMAKRLLVRMLGKNKTRTLLETSGALTSSIAPLTLAAAVGSGIGLGIRETIGGAGATKKYMAEAKSAIGTDAFYKSLSDQISSSGESSNTFITLKAISDKAGKIARRKYLRSTLTGSISMLGALHKKDTWAREMYESFEPLESIAFGDKVIENTMKREMKSKKYGRRYDEHISFDRLKETRPNEYIARVGEEIGFGTKMWTGLIRAFGPTSGEIQLAMSGNAHSTKNAHKRATAVWENIPGLSEVERAQEAVKQKWLTERDGTYNKEFLDVQAVRDNLMDVRKARERMDEHERSNAITAFNNDRLTRGLTWSQ